MTNLQQAAQMALEALEQFRDISDFTPASAVHAITALRAALAEPEQEPVAWLWPHQLEELQHIHQLGIRAWSGKRYKPDGLVAVYTAPTPRKPLTDEEIDRVTDQQWAQNNHKPIYAAHRAYARAIERAHGIGEPHGS